MFIFFVAMVINNVTYCKRGEKKLIMLFHLLICMSCLFCFNADVNDGRQPLSQLTNKVCCTLRYVRDM